MPTLTMTPSATFSPSSLKTAARSSSTIKVPTVNYGWLRAAAVFIMTMMKQSDCWKNDRSGADLFDELSSLATEQAGEEIVLKLS